MLLYLRVWPPCYNLCGKSKHMATPAVVIHWSSNPYSLLYQFIRSTLHFESMCLVFAMPQSSTVLSQFPLNWRKSGKIASATDSSSQTFKRTNLGWCVEAVPGSLCRSLNVLTVLLSCSWASCSSLQVLLSSRLAEHDWGFIEIPRVISGDEDLVRGFQEIVCGSKWDLFTEVRHCCGQRTGVNVRSDSVLSTSAYIRYDRTTCQRKIWICNVSISAMRTLTLLC